LHVATTFPGVTFVYGVVQEILQCLKHQRTEPPSAPIGPLQKPTFQHHGEKILCQVLCVRDGVALAADEREDWPPIDFAKLGKGGMRLLFVTVRIRARQDDAPSGRHEAVGTLGAGLRCFGFHSRGSSHL
jgi:hypothetical protein